MNQGSAFFQRGGGEMVISTRCRGGQCVQDLEIRETEGKGEDRYIG